MKKIIVIGCPGSGKSTFSRALARIIGVPLFYLDMMYWNADRTTVEKSVFLNRLKETLQKDEWIIDGNYASTMESRLQACDTVFFLDYDTNVCLDGIRERRGKPRDDMPWIENEVDVEFVEFVKNFNLHTKPLIDKLLDEYRDKNIIVFTSRKEADDFLLNFKA